MTERDEQRDLPRLPAALKPQDRLVLEMLVLDEDPQDAREFLEKLGVEIGEEDDALAICRKWLNRITKGEQGKLRIRWDDKAPTMDLS